MLLGHQKEQKRDLLLNSSCKCKNADDYEYKVNLQIHFPPPLFFPPALSIECGEHFNSSSFFLVLPALTAAPPLPSVPLRFSTWGHGTSEQLSVAKRPMSWSSRRWTACGSTWRRLTTTPFWRQDTCVCEILLTLWDKVLEKECFCFLSVTWWKKKWQQQVPTIIYFSRNERHFLLLLQLPKTRLWKSALYDVVMGRCSRSGKTK